MGVWGTGLYSGDFAQDLRSAIRAVSRLPFDGERLDEILSTTEPSAANNSNDEDHTTFWLVVADQFAKRGIVCISVRGRALDIIDRGTDIDMLASLGMPPADLRKRRAVLDGLRARLVTPPVDPPPRPVLKKPQEFLLETGDVYISHVAWPLHQRLFPVKGAYPGMETGWLGCHGYGGARENVRFPCLVSADGPCLTCPIQTRAFQFARVVAMVRANPGDPFATAQEAPGT